MPDTIDELANELHLSLTEDFVTIPALDLSGDAYTYTKDDESDLYGDIATISLEDLTEVDLEGEGTFDQLMCAIDLHLEREFKGGRITGDNYAQIYAQMIQGVLSTSVQFLLSKDQARWDAIKAQMEARVAEIGVVQANVELERAKAEAAKMQFDMHNSSAQYALTKMEIANAEARHHGIRAETDGARFQVDYTMPAELAVTQYNRMQVLPSTVAINKLQADRVLPAEAAINEYTHREILPFTRDQEEAKVHLYEEQAEVQRAQTLDTRVDGAPVTGMVGRQKDSLDQDIASKTFNVSQVLPVQLDLVKEQREAERAKTLDTRSDGSTIVTGSVGKQKDLYTQQIDSFVKDGKQKAAKMWFDAWITQKSLDEGISPPAQLNETNINAVLTNLRSENNLT